MADTKNKHYIKQQIEKFYKDNKNRAILIPMNKIILTEKIHKKHRLALDKEKQLANSKTEKYIICHKQENTDKYILITGWSKYKYAKKQNEEKINAILVEEKTRDDFIEAIQSNNIETMYRNYIEKEINIDDIIISENFKKSQPSNEKIQKACDYIKTYNTIEPIICKETESNKYICIDNYTRYIAAKQLKMSHVPIKIIKN